jgi:hypothetical protein
MPQLHKTASHSRASSYGGSTTDHDYTTGSPSGALVGHWVWGCYSGHHVGGSYNPSHGYPEPSPRAETFASARYPNWYAPLEWYFSYQVDQAECVVEGIR